MRKQLVNYQKIVLHPTRLKIGRGMSRVLIAFCILFLTCGLLTEAVSAQSVPQSTFSISPVKPYDKNSNSNSYFSYVFLPGIQIIDEVLVQNTGDVVITLKLLAADGVTAQNGGTSLVVPDMQTPGNTHDVSGWINLSMSEVTLQPGEQIKVPFTLTIPADATPGQHIGGLIAQSQPTSTDVSGSNTEQNQLTVNLIRQVGVALVVDIPGDHITNLQVSELVFDGQSEAGANFVVKVLNSGNTITKAEGNLLITDINDNVLASIPIKVDSLLPGDLTTINLTQAIRLDDANYKMSVGLIFDGGTAILEGIEFNVRQGQLSTAEPSEEVDELVPNVVPLDNDTQKSNSMAQFLVNYKGMIIGVGSGIGFLIIAAVVFVLLQKRKRIQA